jgi:8-oxo-dGTP pyrophosphatase MutT (NUDIX family)
MVTEPAGAEPIFRPGARVFLIDAAGRLLLIHGLDPARPWHTFWITPGGGLDPGESAAEGAARELHEETGLRVDPAALGEPVFADLDEFPFDGRRYRAEQVYFLLRVPAWTAAPVHQTDEELRSVTGYRWWTTEELAATAEHVYPENLSDLLRRFVEG